MVIKKYNDEYLDMKKAKGRAKADLKSSNSSKNSFSFNKFRKSNFQYNPNNSNHVMVKVTGGSNNEFSLLSCMNYDTRENTLPLYDKDGFVIPLDEAKEIALDEFLNTKVKANKKEPPKKTYRFVFSMKGKIDEDLIRESVKETLQASFKDHTFFYSLHPDTDNNHVHVTVMKKSLTNKKNLHIDKTHLNQVKERFSVNLEMKGVIAHFNSETNKQTLEQREQVKKERVNKRADNNILTIIDYGKANYQFDKDSPMSYYLFTKTKNGVIKSLWNNGLEQAIINSSAKIGDKIKIREIKDSNNKSFKLKQWQVEVIREKAKEPMIIIEVGKDRYKFRRTGKPSGFVKGLSLKGEPIILWSKKLADALIKKDIKKGDLLTIEGDDMFKISKAIEVKKDRSIGI